MDIGQFYHVGVDMETPYNVCGGLQDNYSWCGPSAVRSRRGIVNDDWKSIQGGDGFEAVIDPNDWRTVYAESQDGNIVRVDRVTNERKAIRPIAPRGEAPYRWNWNTPIAISKLRHVIRGGSPQTFDVLNRRWVAGSNGEIYHYNFFDPRTNALNGLSVYEFAAQPDRLARRTYVERAAWVGGDNWRLEQGWVREFNEQGRTQSFEPIATGEAPIEPVAHFATQQPDERFMSYSQLRGYVEQLQSSGFDVSEQQVALERKISFPFVTIVMTLIAVPFAVTTGRRGAMYGIGVGIVLALAYWVAISVFAALGTGGLVAPALAAWAPNLLFGAGAGYLLLTVRT
jgi:lipopolysaccharide export LptBFGC system permease protein LptF